MDKIKIFNIDEESLSKLGLALRNDSCRKIMVLLSKNQMYVNQIAGELSIGVNIVSDQIKNLRELGLLDIKSKPITKRTKNHNFYKLKTDIFVSTNDDTTKFTRIFKEGIKFAAIFFVAGISWGYERVRTNSSEFDKFIEDGKIPPTNEMGNFVIPLIVVIIGLSIILAKKYLNR